LMYAGCGSRPMQELELSESLHITANRPAGKSPISALGAAQTTMNP
jgi:hypothetical protein